MKTYNNIIKALIGRPQISTRIDNPFPLIGEQVNILVKSRWVDNHSYSLNDGEAGSPLEKTPVKGDSETTLLIANEGDLEQVITVENAVGESAKSRPVYAMSAKQEPYFNVSVAKEIIRTDGEITRVILSSYNGSSLNGSTIIINIFRENSDTVFKSLSITGDNANNVLSPDISIDSRGIYDIEVQVTSNGVSRKKRINKLITVTPKLAARAQAVEYLCPDTKKVSNHTIDGSSYPAGSTIVLKRNPGYGERYPIRLRFENFKGTWDNPYIITIDESDPFVIDWFGYYGIFIGGCEHIVFDGRGYQNISKGLVLKNMPEFANMCIQAGNYSHELEFFEIDSDGCDFACMSIKTDPTPNTPESWYGAFNFNRLLIHHCTFQNPSGEGNYIGYFNNSTLTGKNSAGETVTYRAHHLYNCRVYRNDYLNCGYDSIQFNNAENLEICYNNIYNSSYKLEADQSSGMSLGMSGKIYNNKIYNHNGPAIQFGVLGETEIYNNIMGIGDRSYMGLLLLADSTVPEQNPGNQGYNEIPIIIHNNIICSSSINVFNARNTSQHKGVIMADNLCVSKKGELMGGQAAATVALWLANAKNNVTLAMYPIDSDALDKLYKIADSLNADFRLAFDSPLINKGCGNYFKTDIDGYYNYYGSTFPAGPYQGIYKNPVIDEQFRILSMIFDGDPNKTSIINDRVNVTWTHYGTSVVTHYMISENQDMGGSTWTAFNENTPVTYIFSGKGERTLYLKLKNNLNVESAIYSKSITLLAKKATICINATTNPSPQYNPVTGLSYVRTKTQNGVSLNFWDNSGSLMGTISKVASDYAPSYNGEGTTTGNNSGIYPDEVLQYNEQAIVDNSTTIKGSPIQFDIAINPGRYRIGMFTNSNRSYSDTATLNTATPYFKISANGVTGEATKLKNNTDTLVYLNNVIVGEDRVLTVKAYWDESVLFAVSKFAFYGALNAISIEET